MGKRIKITGYLYPDDLSPDWVDLSHEMGLSEKGYMAMAKHVSLDDMEIELVDDD
jgi:hypothetical protein